MALALLLSLISLISYKSYREVSSLQSKLTHAAEIPLQKIQFLDSMAHHSRERQVLLRDIVTTTDPFDRDDIILKHQRQAGLYLHARNSLQALLSNNDEKNLLQQIINQNQGGYQVQIDVVDYVVNDEPEKALELIRGNLAPTHEKVYPLMLKLRDLLIEQSAIATSASKKQAGQVVSYIAKLYIFSLVIGMLLVLLAYQVQRKHYREIAWQATHDALTGLINRYQFEFTLDGITRGKNANQAYALFFIDIDQFKLINDTAGHHAGDELLRQISALLSKKMDPDMMLARLGGDEFAILAPNTGKHDVETLATEVLEVFSSFRFLWTDHTFEITASIGMVLFESQQLSKAELFTAADLACHTAKDRGRNRYHVYTPSDMETRSRLDEMHLATKLRKAINNDNLELYHQPIVQVEDQGDFHRTEILLRYMEYDGEISRPHKMILAAEKFGFANTLDEYVVDKVLQHMKANSANDMVYNINLSGQTLESRHTLNRIVRMIEKYGVAPSQICFEITETAAIIRFTDAQNFISTLQELGCVFALDDFGSGVSSFGHLDKLPVDMLKIDASFVQNLDTDESSRAIVLAIREVAKAFDIKVVAEGVENELIRAHVEQLHIDYAQGYGIAMPMPLEEKIA